MDTDTGCGLGLEGGILRMAGPGNSRGEMGGGGRARRVLLLWRGLRCGLCGLEEEVAGVCCGCEGGDGARYGGRRASFLFVGAIDWKR